MSRSVAVLGLCASLASPALAGTSAKLVLVDPIGRPGPRDECTVPACKELLTLIDGAKQSIDFALYGMRDQSTILDALKRAKARGVVIHGAVDMDADGKNYYSSTDKLIELVGKDNVTTDYEIDKEARANARPYNAGFERCERPFGYKGPLQCLAYDLGTQCLLAAHASRDELSDMASIMHDKLFVVDARYVWTGSTNVSDSGTGGYNANLVVVLDSPDLARDYLVELDEMRQGRFHELKQKHGPYRASLDDGTDVELLFSPKDEPITSAVRPLLQSAQTSIDIAIFFLTHKHITRDLIEAHQRGVKVRIIIDASGSTNEYTKHELLRAAGIPVKVETWGGKMHAKTAVVDGKTVITGSMNWTSAGEGGNDENTLILHSERLAAQWTTWYNRLWKDIPDAYLTKNVAPESQVSGAACRDGVDNDYDHLTDAEDPGCSSNPPPLTELPPFKLVAKEEGHDLVKADIDSAGRRLYYLPKFEMYDKIIVDTAAGEGFYCSDLDAKAAGFKQASKGR